MLIDELKTGSPRAFETLWRQYSKDVIRSCYGFVHSADDAEDIAQYAIGEELFEEAFTVYYKAENYEMAIGVLLDHLKDFQRAEEFALKVEKPEVWSKLGVAQLHDGQLATGVNSLIKAKDPSPYMEVINAARNADGSPKIGRASCRERV